MGNARLFLTSTSDQVLLNSSASTISVHASYEDLGPGTYTPGRLNTNFSGVITGGSVVAPPAAGVERNVKTMTFTNTGAAKSNVNVSKTDGSVQITFVAFALYPGFTLLWTDGAGWRVLCPNGAMMVALS